MHGREITSWFIEINTCGASNEVGQAMHNWYDHHVDFVSWIHRLTSHQHHTADE